MILNELNISVTRGETGVIRFNITDENGVPFVMANDDMFDHLEIVFKVKAQGHSVHTPLYLLEKRFVVDNTYKRFAQSEILNLRDYVLSLGGVFLENSWSLPSNLPDGKTFPTNRLFYHPVLNEYRYIHYIEQDADEQFDYEWEWVLYNFAVIVQLESRDTVDWNYGDYYYDLVIEGFDGDVVDYANVLITQRKFTITYRV